MEKLEQVREVRAREVRSGIREDRAGIRGVRAGKREVGAGIREVRVMLPIHYLFTSYIRSRKSTAIMLERLSAS